MEIAVIGMNFRTAPVEVRERVALAPEQARELLRIIRTEAIFEEALILSTCNRTEVYYVAGDNKAGEPPATRHLLEHLAQLKGQAEPTEESAFYRYAGAEAVRHLFRVAGGLDSQVVGEHEILGQLKTAYTLACEARTAGFLLHKLLHWAFRVGKRVLTETSLGQGAASVAAAAVDLAGQIFNSLAGKTVLLVGAGQTAETAARALLAAGASRLLVANRTVARAQQLADELMRSGPAAVAPEDGELEDAEPTCPALRRYLKDCVLAPAAGAERARPRIEAPPLGLGEIPAFIAQADLVLSSTGSTEPVLTRAALAGPLARLNRPLLLVDIAVPRDIEPELGKLPNVFLYNIDGLDRIIQASLDRRVQEIPRATAILAAEEEAFGHWLSSRQVVPTIKLLQERFVALQQAEIERYGRKFTAEDRKQLEEFARTLCNKILHQPVVFLRELSKNGASGEDLAAVDLVRKMFNLAEEK